MALGSWLDRANLPSRIVLAGWGRVWLGTAGNRASLANHWEGKGAEGFHG